MNITTIDDLKTMIGHWADDTFGHPRDRADALRKLREEIDEMIPAAERGEDVHFEEWADCMIVLLDLNYLAGFDAVQAIVRKHEINIKRKWAYDKEKGVWNHVRE